MRKSKFIPEQIPQALRQGEAGTVVAEICRKMGVTEGTFYRWKKQYIASFGNNPTAALKFSKPRKTASGNC